MSCNKVNPVMFNSCKQWLFMMTLTEVGVHKEAFVVGEVYKKGGMRI